METIERPGELATATEAFAGEADQAVLDEELNVIAGHLNAQHARLVDATIELLANPIRWQGPGVWTPEQYLCWRVGLATSRAGQIVDIARRVDQLPICVAAFRRGEMAIDAMATIAKRAPWWTDDTACNYGIAMTVSQLRNVLAKYPFPDIPHPDATDPDATVPDEGTSTGDAPRHPAPDDDSNSEIPARPVDPESGDRCRFGWDDTGRFHMSLDTDAATGAVIETALTEARDALFNDGNADVDWVDAIRELCNRSLDEIDGSDRRDRFRVNIHLDTHGNAVDATGWRLPDAIRRHVICDGLLSPVFVADGIPLSVGRTQRIVPERTRRQVILRDQGCRIPGCNIRRFLEVHHIIHWEDLGPTDTCNLICLCPHHHRLHHRNKLGITGNADLPDGVAFTNVAGNPIAQTGTKPRPPGAPPPTPAGTYRHPLGERLDTKWVNFNPPRGHRLAVGHAATPPDTS
ncbi:MAG: DUF222 domain-containing protein [Acidimicrobiia bacterium]|nr:DUF222 domain-containing protein [Acidimicrobiia bacterium]